MLPVLLRQYTRQEHLKYLQTTVALQLYKADKSPSTEYLTENIYLKNMFNW